MSKRGPKIHDPSCMVEDIGVCEQNCFWPRPAEVSTIKTVNIPPLKADSFVEALNNPPKLPNKLSKKELTMYKTRAAKGIPIESHNSEALLSHIQTQDEYIRELEEECNSWIRLETRTQTAYEEIDSLTQKVQKLEKRYSEAIQQRDVIYLELATLREEKETFQAQYNLARKKLLGLQKDTEKTTKEDKE